MSTDMEDNKAITGYWHDYTTGEHFLSVPNWLGLFLIAILAVWLSWSVKYIKKLLGNTAILILLGSPKQRTVPTTEQPADERTSLIRSSPSDPPKNRQPLAKVYKETSGIRDLAWKAVSDKTLDSNDKRWLALFTFLVALIGSGTIVGGYFLANVRTIGPVLLDSSECGLWVFNQESRSDYATRAGLIDLAKEERASQYAKACYYSYPRFDARRCNFFYRSKILFGEQQGGEYGFPRLSNTCPFKNDICRYNTTVIFETRPTDADVLGINSRTTHKFKRTTACAPLKMDYPFIQNTSDINGTTTYKYYYGEKPGAEPPVNYTYKTVGDPWDRWAPVYDVAAYTSASEPKVWQPLDDLEPPNHSTITLIFVSSLRILYEEPNDDPIFPADLKWDVKGDPRPWWKNSDPRARPLACLNQIEVCAPNGEPCFPYRAPDNETGFDFSADPELTLLFASLDRTDIFDSIRKRQGRALEAQQAISGYFSSSLGENPWIKEVRNLVATAHARTQINAWSIASGEDSVHEGKGYEELTKDIGHLCGKFKYNPQGYASLNFVAFLVMCLLPPTLWFITLDGVLVDRKTQEWRKKTSGDSDGSSTLRSRSGSVSTSQPGDGVQGAEMDPERGPASSPGSPLNNPTDNLSQGNRSGTSNDNRDTEVEWEPLVIHNIHIVGLFVLWLLFWGGPRFLYRKAVKGVKSCMQGLRVWILQRASS